MPSPRLARDDFGSSGLPVILLPGAGDVRSENRFLARALAEAGYRVINADLPGHGESALAESYGVAQTAEALLALVDELGCERVAVIGTSFAPAAAVWAADDRPHTIAAVVAISPHFDADESFAGRMLGAVISMLLRGPWAASMWSRFYRSWYKSRVPDDIDQEIGKMRAMLKDSGRRRAVRETLLAHRKDVSGKIDSFAGRALVVFGSADDHFRDPLAEAKSLSSRLRAESLMVERAGHYPHVERPDVVNPAIVDFLGRVARYG